MVDVTLAKNFNSFDNFQGKLFELEIPIPLLVVAATIILKFDNLCIPIFVKDDGQPNAVKQNSHVDLETKKHIPAIH